MTDPDNAAEPAGFGELARWRDRAIAAEAERDRLRAVVEAAQTCREDEASSMIMPITDVHGLATGRGECCACGEELTEAGEGHHGCWWHDLTAALDALDDDGNRRSAAASSIAESDEYDALQAEIDALELEESALLLADDPANRSCCCGRGEGTKAMSEVERLMRERDDARAEVERLRVVVDAVCHEVAVTLQALAGGQVAGMPPLPPSVARRWARTLRELDGGDHD